jgi:hypothetical protein
MADDRLYSLLPAFDQLRDTQVNGPLRALLGVIGDQIAALEADIARMYDDWFIETCQDWLVPYFADLVEVSLGPAITASAAGALDPVDAATRRSQVANAIRDRRAKGTLAAIERYAADTTGWPGRAVEYAWQVAGTQSVRWPEPRLAGTMPIGDASALVDFRTPFSSATKTADVRRICSHRTRGTRNLPSIGLIAWRLVADGAERAPAECLNDENHFTFDALGRDTQLCVDPVPRAPGQPPAGNLDVPAPITRLALERRLEDYYGEARSLCVYRGREAVERADIVVTDLTHWRYELDPRQVGVDPVLGRIAFPVRDVPEEGVHVSYRRLTVGGLGGGQYHRSLVPVAAAHYLVRSAGDGAYQGVGEAFAAWRRDRSSGQVGARATIEIADDGVYSERLHLELRPGETLEIRSADGHRPVLIPEVEDTDRPEALRVTGLRDETAPPGRRPARARPRRGPGGVRRPPAEPPDSPASDAAPDSPAAAVAPTGPESPPAPAGPPPDVTFDGIWIARHPVLLAGHLGTVTFRHCTLVPPAATRRATTPVSLLIEAMPCAVGVEFSVAGRIQAVSPETGHDPVPLSVTDSILDAGRHDGAAIEGAEGRPAWVSLSLSRVTVLGRLDIREISEARDSIVTGRMESARRQVGRVEFCYLPEDSRTPRRSSCQPDGVLAEVEDAVARGLIPAAQRDEMRRREATRVTPRFDSVRFGAPAYGRLACRAAAELTRGAHDEGELGSYHEWWLAYRAAQLRAGLDAYAPVGMDIDAVFAS